MTFDEYQQKALKTAHTSYDNPLMQKSIWVMGIAGEAGEIVEKWKKAIAYRDGAFTAEQHQDFIKELGDVVWYIAVLADSLGLTLEEVMQLNVKKLADRHQRNVIKGSGDNR
ncbi:MAG TPA: nucleoside triphosphate pyrophosphohydrolase family protein [Verrucomicrobiae bacterium]|jgi:NTP pyrophosphatase (non-canonical NTP hydrolase)|nr:nucleoside triphosphate pyrophosphohydrolase family protein [Verrucomicrobiae bacterium]